LCDYPIDIIKIDRNIITKSASPRGTAVLIGIIRMAHDLGITVLCEGVETEDEKQKVIEAECDYIQGFLYSRVLPIENAMDFYNNCI
jgi:EAL domain-containing protein (putative c-di-GMP-specific phosphodiesterase class I)